MATDPAHGPDEKTRVDPTPRTPVRVEVVSAERPVTFIVKVVTLFLVTSVRLVKEKAAAVVASAQDIVLLVTTWLVETVYIVGDSTAVMVVPGRINGPQMGVPTRSGDVTSEKLAPKEVPTIDPVKVVPTIGLL